MLFMLEFSPLKQGKTGGKLEVFPGFYHEPKKSPIIELLPAGVWKTP